MVNLGNLFPNFLIPNVFFFFKPGLGPSSDILVYPYRMIMKQDTVIEEAPGLGDIKALFPPTSASEAVPLAANV